MCICVKTSLLKLHKSKSQKRMLAHQITEGWGWLDWSGREMKTKYIPFAKRWINIHPKKRLIAKLMQEFPDIKPIDAEKAYRLAYEKYSDNRDKGYASFSEGQE